MTRSESFGDACTDDVSACVGTPLDCVSTPETCRDGMSCVQLPAIFGAFSARLRACVDMNDCDAGMICDVIDFADEDLTNDCI